MKALLRTPFEVDPRLVAKKNVRQRQLLIEGVARDSNLGKLSAPEAKTIGNKVLGDISAGRLKARLTFRQN